MAWQHCCRDVGLPRLTPSQRGPAHINPCPVIFPADTCICVRRGKPTSLQQCCHAIAQPNYTLFIIHYILYIVNYTLSIVN